MKKSIFTKFLLLVMLITSIVGCSTTNKFNLTKLQAQRDLKGQNVTLFSKSQTIAYKNIKEISLKEQTVEGEKAKVIATVTFEFTEKNVTHKLNGDIILNYSFSDNDWKLESIDDFDKLKDTKIEKESSTRY